MAVSWLPPGGVSAVVAPEPPVQSWVVPHPAHATVVSMILTSGVFAVTSFRNAWRIAPGAPVWLRRTTSYRYQCPTTVNCARGSIDA